MGSEVIILGEIVITPLIKAKKSFETALALDKTDITRDATIQRFEFTFELAWKTLKRIFLNKGERINYPKDVIREAAKAGYIESPQKWFGFLESRNQTAHVYNERVAEEIYALMPSFKIELDRLLPKILSL